MAFLNSTIVAFRECSFDLDAVPTEVLVAHLDEVKEAVKDQQPAVAVQAMTRHLSASGCVESDYVGAVEDAAMDLIESMDRPRT